MTERQDHCPCGSEEFDISIMPANPETGIEEHYIATCRKCGFRWLTWKVKEVEA